MDFSTPSTFLSVPQRTLNETSIVAPDNGADLLKSLGVTTLKQWLQLTPDVQRKTIKAAQSLPYKDSPRAWEQKKVLR